MKFHGEILKNLRFCEKEKICHEFCIINMQKWIDFKNKRYKCSRILQVLKKMFQDSQKYSQKGLLVTLFPVVAKNLFYDEKWLFSKESTWYRSPCEEMCGNWSKMGFKSFI